MTAVPAIRAIGDRTLEIPLGFGAMWLSLSERRPAPGDAIAVIHAALDAGLRLIDTADAYAHDATEHGHNERLVAAALARWSGDRDDVVVVTKGGHVRDTAGGWSLNGSYGYLLTACERSLRALGVDVIDVYLLHRPDPATPIEESAAALAELRQRGWIRHAGLSNVDADQLRRVRRFVDVDVVSNELSPRYRASLDVLERCDAAGVAFLPWRPLGGVNTDEELRGRYRTFAEIAERHRVTPQQVALAWSLHLSPQAIPLIGATRPQSITDSARATHLRLRDDELRGLSATLPVNQPS